MKRYRKEWLGMRFEDIKMELKRIDFSIAFLVEQLKDETDEDVVRYISSKIKEYERESKQLARELMQSRYKSVVR